MVWEQWGQDPFLGKFEEDLQKALGDFQPYVRRAEEMLNVQVQKLGESPQSYIQNALSLCSEVNSKMSKEDILSHLMKEVSERSYQALLTKEIKR